ncbi:MAG: DegT/DnrJ/EryC1/StrS family aminotransferase [Candidatus Woesearchaeota archaeon]
MIPITKPTLPKYEEVEKELRNIIESGMITNAKYVRELEKNAAEYIQIPDTAALSSCTSGLILTQKLLNLKGEVILPSFTFHATAHSLVWNNLKPKFVDIEENHYNIDPQKVNEAITPNTSAILAVHMFGHPADTKALQEIAKDNNLKLIFDAAHAFGSKINNLNIGRFGDAEVFSLSPTKLLTAGEGGIVSSNNKVLIKKLKIARNYGDDGSYNCEYSGLNARMSELNGILGIKTLQQLDQNIENRNKLAEFYKQKLSKLKIGFQKIAPNVKTTYKDFSLYINPEEIGINRDELCNQLEKKGIISKKYFYPPVHKQTAFKEFNNLRYPITEKVSTNVLSVPLYSHMKKTEVEKVCDAISTIIQENGRK